MSRRRRADPAIVVLGALALYDLVQNLVLPERAYVPANVAATAALVGYARRAGVGLEEMGCDRFGRGAAWGSGAAAGFAATALVAAGTGRLDRLLLDERGRGHGRAGAVYRAVVRFPVGTALFEEVAFRGVLDALWRRRGDRAARLVTAAAFGAWHLVPSSRLSPKPFTGDGSSRMLRAGVAIGSSVLAGLAGRGFTALRERSGSLLAPWMAHVATNTGSYLLARRAWRRSGSGRARSRPHAPARAIATSTPT